MARTGAGAADWMGAGARHKERPLCRVCQAPLRRTPALSVSGLCVGSLSGPGALSLSVSGPGGLSVGARRSLCQGLALSHSVLGPGPGALCRAPALFSVGSRPFLCRAATFFGRGPTLSRSRHAGTTQRALGPDTESAGADSEHRDATQRAPGPDTDRGALQRQF